MFFKKLKIKKNNIIFIIIYLTFIGCAYNKQIEKIKLSDMYYIGEIVDFDKDIYSEPYPTPFSPPTIYHFDVNMKNSNIKVKLFDLKGNLISTVFEGILNPGSYEIKRIECYLNPGVYIWKIQINEEEFKKMYFYGSNNDSIENSYLDFELKNGKVIRGDLIKVDKNNVYVESGRILHIINKEQIQTIFEKDVDKTTEKLNHLRKIKINYNRYLEIEEIK